MTLQSQHSGSPGERWRIELLFGHSVSPFASLFLIPPLFVYVLSAVVDHRRALGWLAGILILTLLRLVHVLLYFRAARRQNVASPRRWEWQYATGVVMSGMAWGASTWLLFPSSSVMHQAFLCFVVAGMVAGAVSAYSPSMPAVSGYLVALLVPFILRLAIENTRLHHITALMTLVFLALCLGIARRMNYYLREHFRMREEQAVLLRRLQIMNEELENSISSLHRSQVETLHASRLAAVGEMSAGIAHEINNPLAIIEGTTTRLIELSEKRALTDETLAHGLDRIRQTVDRISRVIQGLLMFSGRSRQQAVGSTPLEKIFSQTLDLCRQRFVMNGVELQVAPLAGEIVVSCVPVQICQVILNLLNNAFDAIVPLATRWVKLEAIDQGDWVEIAVIDSGHVTPGTATEEWFQPFFTTKEIGKGTGLGLSVSKGIVEQHGGRIWVESGSSHTRVAFTVPKAAQRQAA